MLRHPPFAKCSQKLPIGRGTKALNPGGAGAKPPQAASAPKLPSEARAPSYNALKGKVRWGLTRKRSLVRIPVLIVESTIFIPKGLFTGSSPSALDQRPP